ncbi:MAG: hypothetical protein KIT31_07305 [Deltaproteobacteria bacterium]|nr:hypothetical protein [Deltaproteobacteria bacterium]
MRYALLLAGLVACADPPPYEFDDAREPCPALGAVCDATPGAAPAVGAPTIVSPSTALPPGVTSQTSNNNLDIVWYRGRLFYAFRTGPSHFASRDVVMYVMSTADHVTWTHEATFDMNRDLREPRFLVAGDRLFFYFAVLGDYAGTFEPLEARVSELLAPGEWSASQVVFEPGFIPWRAKTFAGKPMVIGYVGGENIYETDGEPVRVSWWTTEGDDGRAVVPMVPGKPIVLEGGSSETDLVALPGGGLFAVSRNELGDDLGWGSKLCRAEAGDLGNWRCVGDPRKYDSPIVFEHGADIYMIARRQVTADGHYDLMLRNLPPAEQTTQYNVNYWITPKRCALWKLDPVALSAAHVLDLPSSGDTCFPGVVPLGAGRYLVYNYTSPLEGDLDRPWMKAQFEPTQIHYLTLTIP